MSTSRSRTLYGTLYESAHAEMMQQSPLNVAKTQFPEEVHDELTEALRRFTHVARDTRFWHMAKPQWMREHPGAEPDHSAIAQLADALRQA